MEVISTRLSEVKVICPRVFKDPRGYFTELFQKSRYDGVGVDVPFVQDNLSYSSRDTLRGLHFQNPFAQGKLVSCLQGEIFDVVVDIRVGSPQFGEWFAKALSCENHHQLFVPAGFAHGFLVTSETAIVHYKTTDFYHPEAEHTLLWNDPRVGIEWPTEIPAVLSEKDARAKSLEALSSIPGALPVWNK